MTSAGAGAATPAVLRAQDFVNTEGVNTHINYTDGRYADIDALIKDLKYLGVTHIRDGIYTPGRFGAPGIATYAAIAKAGNKFSLLIGSGGTMTLDKGTPTDPSLTERIGYIDQLVDIAPGSVTAVEGPNEINNWPITFKTNDDAATGSFKLSDAISLQHVLYALVHGDPKLKAVSVYYFTGYGAGGVPMGPDPATTAGLADFNNQHPYPNFGQAPAFWMSRTQALANESPLDNAATKPAVYTETGYSSNGGTSGNVSSAVQAKYTLDLFLDSAKNNISGIYLYELLDAYPPGSPQGDAGFGLFDYKNNPKPIATALHNMNIFLTDPSPSATSFDVKPLNYSITGEQSHGAHLTFEKADGTYVIALWDERPIWDTKLGTETTVVPYAVTISLANLKKPVITEFDPMDGVASIDQIAGSKATISISDHPIFLEIKSDRS